MIRAFRRLEVVYQTPARYFPNQPHLGFIRKTSTVKSSHVASWFLLELKSLKLGPRHRQLSFGLEKISYGDEIIQFIKVFKIDSDIQSSINKS